MGRSPYRPAIAGALCAAALLLAARPAPAQAPRAANVVILVSDDAGYADFTFNGTGGIATPSIDRIAAEGVRFAEGYVTASVCSPSRAGLLTGRYQQRFGHHRNIPPRYSEENGLPVDEATLADALSGLGYRTLAVGKWHLGYAPQFHPLSRGFDGYFGFLQGSRSYWPIEGTPLNRMLRDRDPVPEEFAYVTDVLGDEAAAYVDAHHEEPFFLYVAFSAVHGPLHAKEDQLAAAPGFEGDAKRRKIAAMTAALDAAVGRVLDALDRHDLAEDTLVVFVNDNGGQTENHVSNVPLRGKKGQPYEGGIRVPFAARWPARWPGGVVFHHPVSTLDILPTAIAAAGGDPAAHPAPLDGVDLTPFLLGTREGGPHEVLHWLRGQNFAVRRGDWKLLREGNGALELYDLSVDSAESDDRAAAEPELVRTLLALHEAWAEQLSPPRW